MVLYTEQHANNPQFAGEVITSLLAVKEHFILFFLSLSHSLACAHTHTQMMHSLIIVSLLVSSLGTAIFAQCQGGMEGKLVLYSWLALL